MDLIKDFKISKTVYSLCFPETENLLRSFLSKNDFSDFYNETWTKKQDLYHLELSEGFKEWSKDYLKFNQKHFYPTNGSSEAIREQICYLISLNKNIIVFEGEYEGYEAIVNSLGKKVIKIKREDYKSEENLEFYNKDNVFFISQPSSIDGNYWKDFDNFIKLLELKECSLYVDIVYLGCTKDIKLIDLTSNIIKGVFFSLSKSFGVYYHRIGGCYLREENPLLYGNMWFKNILSMKFGIELMKNFKLGYFPNKYNKEKKLVSKILKEELNFEVVDSDSLLLINIKRTNTEIDSLIERNKKSEILRVCITPKLEEIIKGNK